MIICDPKRMKQVFVNLLGNAMKFTETGHIHFKVSCENHFTLNPYKKFDGYYSKYLMKDSCKQILTFEIEDTGIGIDQDNLHKLFKAFGKLDDITFRTKTRN